MCVHLVAVCECVFCIHVCNNVCLLESIDCVLLLSVCVCACVYNCKVKEEEKDGSGGGGDSEMNACISRE